MPNNFALLIQQRLGVFYNSISHGIVWIANHVHRRPTHFGISFACAVGFLSLVYYFPINASASMRSETIYIPFNTSSSTDEFAQYTTPVNAQTFKVKSGDSLATLFQRAGLTAKDVHDVINNTVDGKELTKIVAGKEISIEVVSGKLHRLSYQVSQLDRIEIRKTQYGIESFRIKQEPQTIQTVTAGTINSSLFVDGKAAGLSQKIIMELANIFAWDIDFALDIRKGDSFKVIYDEKFVDGVKIGDGEIVAAEFINRGKPITAVRYVYTDGSSEYFTPEGESMRKTFLRAPVDFTRISSNFNPNRLHPILKTLKPHNGIDYAAPTGTPIYSAGAGKVIASGYSDANGNYVFIQHGQMYVTKYLHMTKRLVKTGQSVRQGETIGTVGSTGYATGPHLHYEFLINGVHQNPSTVKLPNGESIPSSELARFKSLTSPYIAMLRSSDTNIAQSNLKSPSVQ